MKFTPMSITYLGFIAGAMTSSGFLPQILKGYKTKKLDDISYFMPIVLAVGMLLWLFYGIGKEDYAIIAANTFGIGCNVVIIFMKFFYNKSLYNISN